MSGKYHAIKVKADGYTFDSKAEYRRYMELRLLEQGGVISAITVHPVYLLTVNGVSVGKYIGDFVFTDENGRRVVEDVKGVLTPVYRLKKKLVKALHGIEIVEVKA